MNYYKILNIQKNSSLSEIKLAYRKLALKYHPDKPTGNENKFKEITEAYEVLSDSQKRIEYDNPHSKGIHKFTSHNPNDIFNVFFGRTSNDNPLNDMFSMMHGMDIGSTGNFIQTTTVRYPDGRVETQTTRSHPNSFRQCPFSSRRVVYFR